MIGFLVRVPLILGVAVAMGALVNAARFPNVKWRYTPPPPLPEGTLISLEQFRGYVEAAGRGELVAIIDAREPAEFAKGHVGAFNLLNVHERDISSKLSALEALQGYQLVLYCTSPTCDLAEKTLHALESMGWSGMKIYGGGWEGWTPAGLPADMGPETIFGQPFADAAPGGGAAESP